MTTDGWIPVGDITKDHKVASLEDGQLRYVNPLKVMDYDCDQEVYEINTSSVSLKVTKNHRMWIGDRNGKNFNIKLAEDCYGKRWKFMKNCEEWVPDLTEGYPKEFKMDVDRQRATHFLIHDDEGKIAHEFPINAWLAFFWYLDGRRMYIRRRYTSCSTQR